MTWNPAIAKQTLELNNAGNEIENPILDGLPFSLSLRLSMLGYSNLIGYAGTLSPPTNAFYFTQDETDELLYTHSFVAGTFPLESSQAGTKNNIRVIANNASIWEKKIYIRDLPETAIQVYDRENEWVSVNIDTLPAIPTCCQMCPIRFFAEWFDEFSLLGFGGARYVSIFDTGTSENDTSCLYVNRAIDQKIEDTHYIYLVKHALSSNEQHYVTIRFKTTVGEQEDYVDVNIHVVSPKCWGFQIRDPEY